MNMEEKKITTICDREIKTGECIKLKFSYNDKMTLKDLSELLDLTNKAFNDVNRDNGVGNKKIGKEYASEVAGVEEGSVVVLIVSKFVAPVAISVLANYIYDRIKKMELKKDKRQQSAEENTLNINVDGNNSSIIINFGEK